MIGALVGKKQSMSMRFNQAGQQVPVTVLVAGPCLVTQLRTLAKDGYTAVQLGFNETKSKRLNRSRRGLIKKAGLKKSPRFLFEAGLPADEELKVGAVIKVDQVFQPGDLVKVTGRSKGRGFAGVMKRWGFAGGPRTHGQSDRQRAPGSIGQTTDPGRVWPGKKMAGRMGNQTVTIKNLVVQEVSPEDNLLWLKGSVPGSRNNLLIITKTGHNDKFIPLVGAKDKPEEKEKKEFSQ